MLSGIYLFISKYFFWTKISGSSIVVEEGVIAIWHFLTLEVPEQSFWMFSPFKFGFLKPLYLRNSQSFEFSSKTSKIIAKKSEWNEIKNNKDIFSYTYKRHEQSNWLLLKFVKFILFSRLENIFSWKNIFKHIGHVLFIHCFHTLGNTSSSFFTEIQHFFPNCSKTYFPYTFLSITVFLNGYCFPRTPSACLFCKM